MSTLKDLRKFKGLTQAECAKIVGVPLRTYQNYENDDKKVDTYKYYYIVQKLVSYGRQLSETYVLHDRGSKHEEMLGVSFIMVGKKLKECIDSTKGYKKRFCYEGLKWFIENEQSNKVCILL